MSLAWDCAGAPAASDERAADDWLRESTSTPSLCSCGSLGLSMGLCGLSGKSELDSSTVEPFMRSRLSFRVSVAPALGGPFECG